jgi:LuxR family maltose regulon positive regulatory protein
MTTERAATPAGRPSTLLRSRTTAPAVSALTLVRPRLLERLDEGTRGAVTLVVGGPGSGKSQLVASWMDDAGDARGVLAWAALGEDCNDVQRLWALVTAALAAVDAAGPLLEELRAPADVDDAYVERVLLALDSSTTPVVLVLEDLHEVQAPEALASLDVLVRGLPVGVGLVLISRADPTLSLHRLRVAGELAEIRQDSLSFDRAEAVALLAQHDVVLLDPDVDLLLERTEGWAVGLRLAALSLEAMDDVEQRSAAVAAFAGDHRTVADYLVAEVLDRLGPELRRFLLQTSVVERVNAELAGHLTGGPGGAEMLEQLERAGVPLVRLDGRGGWYRHHRLVQDLCRHRLSVEDPTAVPLLQSRAAEWLADAGEYDAALRLAIRAANWPLTGRLAVTHAGPVALGHAGRAIRTLLREIPDEAAPGDPWVAVARGLGLHDEGRPAQLEQLTASAAILVEALGPDDRAVAEVVLALVRAAAARALCDVDLATSQSRLALDHAGRLERSSPTRSTPVLPSLPGYVALADVLLGKSLVWQGRLEEAEEHLRRATAATRPGRPDPGDSGIHARAYLSLALAMRGELGAARLHAEESIGLARSAGWSDDVQSTSAWVALVLVHLQRSGREECQRALDEAARVLERRPDRLLDICRWLATARFLAEDGRARRAREILSDVRRMLGELPPNPFLEEWHLLVSAELEASVSRPTEARLLIERDRALRASPRGRLVHAQALLDEGRPVEAIEEVDPLVDFVSGGLYSVQALVVIAMARDAERQDGSALQALGRALDQGVAGGHLRPFYRHRQRLLPLLGRYAASGGPHARLVTSMLELDHTRGHRDVPPLTERELSVLQLLPSMLSNDEIATELFVSVNTVKVHLKSLYRKLGAGNRREAVALAAGLLER